MTLRVEERGQNLSRWLALFPLPTLVSCVLCIIFTMAYALSAPGAEIDLAGTHGKGFDVKLEYVINDG